jgi:hypothetical protein
MAGAMHLLEDDPAGRSLVWGQLEGKLGEPYCVRCSRATPALLYGPLVGRASLGDNVTTRHMVVVGDATARREAGV